MSSESSIKSRFSEMLIGDRIAINKRLRGLKKITDNTKRQHLLEEIEAATQDAQQRFCLRRDAVPAVEYPEQLPVSQKQADIAKAIDEHQVVIIAGETGSGKTTQIPKICLQLGRGQRGLIGHTQPRRLAARSVADRIAEELKSPLGQYVGYKVRFSDQVSDKTYIKLMTDGILLAEIQRDRFLNAYDTIIIDEAHERSLNIDFILGYLKQLLPKRPDLKLIITSATIDPERFSRHFSDAPIIEVSGRTFPVEMRYRPVQDEQHPDRDQTDAIIDAVRELEQEKRGDILVFLSGEREIRDTAEALNKAQFRHTEVLPLFARLSAAEQQKIFKSHAGRRIVLATNVAETSLTVPGIRYVIDPGFARISRYSYRTKVQRLPIEAVSQASANQRAGRCGRVAEGVCIRLYSEEDYLNRPEFTDPEILRTNLASVILQMLSLKLGDISAFPFVEPPDQRFINDGMRLLTELQAIDNPKRQQQATLTELGRKLARLPVDPRLARMLLAAVEFGSVHQVAIIVSALSIQDPRERPLDKQQAADEAHKHFADKDSDLLAFVNLWNAVKEQQKALSNSQFRKWCKKQFLNYLRVREWQDIYSQLSASFQELGLKIQSGDADFAAIHKPLIAGSLSQLGFKDKDREFLGARNSRFMIFPGSGLAKKAPKWILAAELMETSRLFARGVAKIEREWVLPLSQHLVNRSHSEPHWQKKTGKVVCFEKQTLYGLVIEPKKVVPYAPVDAAECRQLFIRQALVEGELGVKHDFLSHNRKLTQDIEALEKKQRRRDLLVDEETLVNFYHQVLPEQVLSRQSFDKWWKKAQAETPKLLHFDRDALLKRDAQAVTKLSFPDNWQQGDITLKLRYDFEPGEDKDGITVLIPIGILNQISSQGFEWGIPGYRHELLVALIKSLPKTLRRNFVPAPNYADALLQAITDTSKPLMEVLPHQLLRMTGVRIPDDSFDVSLLPQHLRMRFEIHNGKGKVLATGRDLEKIKAELKGEMAKSLTQVADKGIEKAGLTDWDFGEIPRHYQKNSGGYKVKAYPALVDQGRHVDIKLFDNPQLAEQAHRDGQRRLLLLAIPSPIKHMQQALPNKAKLGLYYNPFGNINDLINDCINAAVDSLLRSQFESLHNAEQFELAKEYVRAELGDKVVEIAAKVEPILTAASALKKKLKGKTSFQLVHSQSDIQACVSNLIYKGFVVDAGAERLSDILRYIDAQTHRFEKLKIDANKDRLAMIEIETITKEWQHSMSQFPADNVPAELTEIRWAIEELKVSLFAQKLGTNGPVSTKRIRNQLNLIIKQS